MVDSVTPITPTKMSLGNKILDTVIGLGAMLLLVPIAPFIILIWLWDRVRRENAPAEN